MLANIVSGLLNMKKYNIWIVVIACKELLGVEDSLHGSEKFWQFLLHWSSAAPGPGYNDAV